MRSFEACVKTDYSPRKRPRFRGEYLVFTHASEQGAALLARPRLHERVENRLQVRDGLIICILDGLGEHDHGLQALG